MFFVCVCVCVCTDGHRHGYKQQCNAHIKNRQLFLCDRKAGRTQGGYFSCYTAVLKTRERERARVFACLVLPGFSKLFEQTGSVLVPPSSEPPLHLSL